MKAAREKVTKKSRGRPATGTGIQVGERWSSESLERIDDWRRTQDDLPGRPEAIRRLVEIGLERNAAKRTVRKPGQKERANELATKTIDRMMDPAAPSEERAQRKRRLTKGPSEFREDRVDLPKAKGSAK